MSYDELELDRIGDRKTAVFFHDFRYNPDL